MRERERDKKVSELEREVGQRETEKRERERERERERLGRETQREMISLGNCKLSHTPSQTPKTNLLFLQLGVLFSQLVFSLFHLRGMCVKFSIQLLKQILASPNMQLPF